MVNDIATITIKGGIFEQDTTFPLFDTVQKKKRFCLVYGKNGSGKTTISRAFSKIAGNEEETIENAFLLDSSGNTPSIDPNGAGSIYVFNEEFVKNKIQIEVDGLNTIVLMGAKKEVDDKIKKLTPIVAAATTRRDEQQNEVDEYCDANNPKSPEYYKKRMIDTLKGENSWAQKDAYIHGKKQNSKVTEDAFRRFIDLRTDKTRDELIIEYDKLNTDFQAAKNGTQLIAERVKTDYDFCDIEDSVRDVLAEKIERPVLSERERYLFSLLNEDGGFSKLDKAKTFFNSKDKNRCPFCFQSVTDDYAAELVTSIEKILSKKAEEHVKALENFHQEPYETNLRPFEALLDGEKIKVVSETLQTLNAAIEELNHCLERKKSNVYEEVTLADLKLREKFDAFIGALGALEEERNRHNANATNTTVIIERMSRANDLITMYDIKPLYDKYNEQLTKKRTEESKLRALRENLDGLLAQLSELEQEKKNATIAMESINRDLKYIFFSGDRLRIDYKEGKYILYSNGKNVAPNHVSIGERNALGLSYFFNSILNDKNEETAYDHPYLIVIDDPVSSFDMENKVGVLSYLRYALSKFALGNESTRFLLMTHDLQTLYDLEKIVDEILLECHTKFSGRAGQDKKSRFVFELTQGEFQPNDVLNRHEYTSLLEQIYEYAKNPEPQYSLVIGNMMRKAIEAFSTFVYKKGIADVSTDHSIISELEEPYRTYFQNLMYRIVLHGSSHMSDRVRSLDDMDFFEFISDSEKQRTAKDLLCFLYKLNKYHVLAHLSLKTTAEADIGQWCIDNIETE